MASKKGDTRQSFNDSVHNKQFEKKKENEKVNAVPKMIREEQSVPHPKPPSIGKAIDTQSFNRRWQQQVNAAKPLDAFDMVDKQHKNSKLNHNFNESAKTGKKQGLERD